MLRTSVSLLALLFASPALAGTYVFGDSSVEQGNLYALPGYDRTGSPYYAPDGLSRESNGPVWVEHLVPGMVAYAGAEPGDTDINFAFSGATSGDDNIAGPVLGTGLDAQIDRFAGLGRPVRPDDLFVMAIGTNDFIRDLGVRDLRETSTEVIGNIGAGVDRLAGLGASRILVEDVPNFHLAPAFAGLVPPEDQDAFDGIMRGILDKHRADQIAALRAQNGRLGDTDIAVVKISLLFDHVLENAEALGFANVTDGCYDEVSGTLCSADRRVQNTYLFFDSLHLTEAGQRIQADYYRALLGQLDGTAHILPAAILNDTARASDSLASRARDERFAAWAAQDLARGFTAWAEAGAGADSSRLTQFGVGWSDGESWTVRADLARRRAEIAGLPGSSDVEGWSVVLSGERRWGDLRLGASAGTLSGEAEGVRRMPVALMQAAHSGDFDSRFAEVSAGYVFSSGALTVQPAVWVRWSGHELAGFTERGATGLEMQFDETSLSGFSAGAGVNARYAATDSVTPWISLGWEDAVSGLEGPIRGRLVDNSADDIVRQFDVGQGGGEARVGVDLTIGSNASLRVAGWATTEEDEGAYVRLGWRF